MTNVIPQTNYKVHQTQNIYGVDVLVHYQVTETGSSPASPCSSVNIVKAYIKGEINGEYEFSLGDRLKWIIEIKKQLKDTSCVDG